MMIRTRVRQTLVACVLALTLGRPVFAWPTPQELLNDFTHYAIIANIELAAANAQALMDSGITDDKLAELLDEGKVTPKRFDDAIGRAMMIKELEPIAAELNRRVEAGRLDLARHPKRVAEAVNWVVGTRRARLRGEQRVAAAGE
jgi:hypothetical protein